MKKILVLSALLITSFSLFAQVRQPDWVGDTLGPWSEITFDEPSAYIQIIPSAQNLWQIGTPQKTFFNEAFTPPNAMVTDTMNFYTDNNLSYFELSVGDFNANWSSFYDLFIDFRHKFDSDTLHDGGYVTVSWDNRQTWQNIIDDTVSTHFYWITPSNPAGFWGNTDLYKAGDTLFNGEHGFSGRSNGWVHSCMAWYSFPVKQPVHFPGDTIFFRFNFISDNTHHNREGWMIDQIRIFSIDLGGGIRMLDGSGGKAVINPNPITTDAVVTLDRVYSQVKFSMTDMSGRVVQAGTLENSRLFTISRASLSPGSYFLKITMDQGLPEVHRIIIRN